MKIKSHLSGRKLAQKGALDVTKSKWTGSELDALGFGVMDNALIGPATHNGFIDPDKLNTQYGRTIRTATQVNVLDEITGVTVAGQWHDETIQFNFETLTGKAELYGDHSNIPLASYVQNLTYRGIVRFELGFEVTTLEDARQSAAGYDVAATKRAAQMAALDASRHEIGYYGFTAPNTRTFGLLNDPNLPDYETGTDWKTGGFATITGDIISMFTRIEAQSGGRVKDNDAMTLVLPLGYRQFMSVSNETGRGQTISEWLQVNYPNVRTIYSPEFVGANGGANIAYLFADSFSGNDDDAYESTIIQIVPTRHQVRGSQQGIKSYIELATNATAGVVVLFPQAVTRLTGI